MLVRSFRSEDAAGAAALSAACARGESDFVLNPLWESPEELFAELARHRIAPEDHLLVADGGGGSVLGVVGFVRPPGGTAAGLFVPIVDRRERGRGHGGDLLRAALAHGQDTLGIKLVSAAIGSRNHAGYALLTGCGFRPVRQHFLMRLDTPPKNGSPGLRNAVFEPAVAGDAPAVLALYEACGFSGRTEEDMENVIADSKRAVAVARLDGRVVAFTELETHWPGRVWVAYVGVTHELRDRGLGSALVSWALARQFEAGARSALLLLSPANRTALRAYEKTGFRRHRMIDVLEKGL
jgi:ribosomal protein S18 acetylase RimI-like enzyme